MKSNISGMIKMQKTDNGEYYQDGRQLRATRQKNAILRVLSGTTSHPIATWIYEEVRKEIRNISLGTVYRNLKQMKKRGEILELVFNGTASRFDARTDSHEHFICEKCDWVFDVDEPENIRLERQLSQKTGFEISRYRLELFGLCGECKGRQ